MKSDNGQKKVFAEYHNPRYTREQFDGVGNWKYVNESKTSRARVKRYNYNADLIDEMGKHQIASVNYPVIGMQSQNDPDYIEYQILLAKMAHIDGFMTDFRHIDDPEGMAQVELLKQMAERYGFEVGVDWCDAQIFYSLLKKRSELDTREKQIEYCKGIFKYLLENIYTGESGATIQGHPAIWLFGDGFSFEEYTYLKGWADETLEPKPWYFRRAMMKCEIDGNKVTYHYDTDHDYFCEHHRGEIAGPFGWIPFRLRDAVKDGKELWDVYATKEDCLNYLDTLFEHVRENRNRYQALVSVVTPGMDQRGCAAWGRPICLIEREEGELYRAMWEYNVARRDEVDAVFIAGWNDYNEGHEIEPTVKNGYREIELTAKYAAQFKGIEEELEDPWFRLPEQLFRLRKRAGRIREIGLDAEQIMESLTAAAKLIAARSYPEAVKQLSAVEEQVIELESKISVKQICLSDFGVVCHAIQYNLSPYAAAFANTQLEYCEASRALDGEGMRSYWKTDAAPSVLEVSLPEETRVEAIMIKTGLLERSDTPNWPMVLKHLVVEYQSDGKWESLTTLVNQSEYELKIPCGLTVSGFRFTSNDPQGVVIRSIDILSGAAGRDGYGCYDGLGLSVREEMAAIIRGHYFEGWLEFDYLDIGFSSFAVYTSSHKYSTVCEITKDHSGAWKHAKVNLYHCNTAFDHSLEDGCDFLFEGDAEVKNIKAYLNIYQKNIEGESE